jgi:hypothetical protein
MRYVIKYYRLFNILSLDVASGAIVCSLFFAKLYGASPSFISLLSLGLTVWLIYTADRLLDVWDARGEISSERHQFHKKNQKILVRWLVVIAIIDAGLIFFMPVMIIKRGLFLSMVVIGYVLFRRNLYIFKEFFVAVFYTAGVMLPAVPAVVIEAYTYLPMFQFFLIALLNLIIFSWYERDSDLRDKQDSIATKVDGQTIRTILLILFFMAFSILCSIMLLTKAYYVSLVLLVMTASHLLIFLHKNLFEGNYLYRLIGDAAFLFPIIYILS